MGKQQQTSLVRLLEIAAEKKGDAFKAGDWKTRSGDETSCSGTRAGDCKGMLSGTTASGGGPVELVDVVEELP